PAAPAPASSVVVAVAPASSRLRGTQRLVVPAAQVPVLAPLRPVVETVATAAVPAETVETPARHPTRTAGTAVEVVSASRGAVAVAVSAVVVAAATGPEPGRSTRTVGVAGRRSRRLVPRTCRWRR